jgi:hypothetical protein
MAGALREQFESYFLKYAPREEPRDYDQNLTFGMSAPCAYHQHKLQSIFSEQFLQAAHLRYLHHGFPS